MAALDEGIHGHDGGAGNPSPENHPQLAGGQRMAPIEDLATKPTRGGDTKMSSGQIGLEIWNVLKGRSSSGAGKLWQVARQHPMPAAVIGLGLGWLMVESSRKPGTYDGRDDGGTHRQGYAGLDADEGSGLLAAARSKVHDVANGAQEVLSAATGKVGEAADWTKEHAADLGHQVADKASDLGHQVADKASALSHQARDLAAGLGTQAQQQVRRVRLGFWQTMEENPLLVGAAVLAAGVVAGLALPSTDKEDELMGETRDRLLDQAKEAGQQALDKGKHVAEAVVDKVKEEAQHQGLTPEGMAEKVKTVAREATNTAVEEAQRQHLVPDAGSPSAPARP
jgi:hypothetical protein